MYTIVLYLLIILSVVALTALIIGKIPALVKLSDEEIAILSNKKGFFQKCREINFRQHFFNFIVSLEKVLRKLKIVFLKVENILGNWIKKLSESSQVMASRSREWMKHKEEKKIEKKNGNFKKPNIVMIKEPVKDALPFSELEKPTKEEQKWIDLIVENPKNITAYKFLGVLYWKQHNYTDAKASLEMAVKLGSRDKKIQSILEEIREKEEEV